MKWWYDIERIKPLAERYYVPILGLYLFNRYFFDRLSQALYIILELLESLFKLQSL